MLRRAPSPARVADTAAFLACDRAGGITGTIVNVTCGLVPSSSGTDRPAARAF
jgi:hypothetical protein